MSISAGDSGCTIGLSKALYDALLADARIPWPASMTDAQKATPKAVAYAIAAKVAEAANADSLTVHAACSSSTGQSIPRDSTTVVNFATKDEDTHNAVTTGASWRFTTPAGKGGRYLVAATCTFGSGFSDGVAYLVVRINGTEARRIARATPSLTNQEALSGSTVLTLAAGQEVDVAIYHLGSTSEALEAMAVSNHVTITRLGD